MMRRNLLSDHAPDAHASLQRWLKWLEALDPARIELGLERVRKVYDALSLTPAKLTIVVAGTNGKGSCVAMFGTLLRATGRSVGRYTSPHLSDFRERIIVNEQMVDEQTLVRAFSTVREAAADTPLTYFEFTTLAAFVVFTAERVDAWVLEVGLGGRLDAVNVVQPDVALVTNIGMDHEQWLGHSLAQIGTEKAGVFRANIPAVVGTRQPPASLLAVIESIGAQGLLAERDFDHSVGDDLGWNWRGMHTQLDALPALSGAHQRDNASAVLASLESIGVLGELSRRQVRAALGAAAVPARLELRSTQPAIILDVAHNVDSVRVLAQYLSSHAHAGETWLVFGAMADKAVAQMVDLLRPVVDRWIAVAPPLERALGTAALADMIRASGAEHCQIGSDPLAGFEIAKAAAKPADRIVVAGSFSVVGPVRAAL